MVWNWVLFDNWMAIMMMKDISPLELELLESSMNAIKPATMFEEIKADKEEKKNAIQRLQSFGLLVTKENVISNRGLAHLVVDGNRSFYDIWQEHPSDFSVMSPEFYAKYKAFDSNKEYFDIYFWHYLKHHILNDLFNSQQYHSFRVPRDMKEQRKFEIAIVRRLIEDGRIEPKFIFAMFGYSAEAIGKTGMDKASLSAIIDQVEKML